MWDTLFRVDWGRLTHAYGWARDTPTILHNMIAPDEATRTEGWDAFWSAINHQGSFYDSTVAAVPFLIEAAAYPGNPERARILYCLRDRWLEAPERGGDPVVIEPPGGTDIPTPRTTDEQPAAAPKQPGASAEQDGEEAFDIDSYRRMDLCAWQTGRAIQAGRPTFEQLLEDPDLGVASAAGALLLLWPETRPLAKQALIRTVACETNPLEQGRRILEFGVYAASDDVCTLAQWVASGQPAAIQAAAALVWAWVANPGPLPPPAAAALYAASDPSSDAFAKLPWAGVYHRGPSLLPANAAEFVLRLAENNDRELRWRAVQGLAEHRETAKHLSAAQVVPVLLKCLSDDYNRIRAAAALALSQRGPSVLDIEPNAALLLIRALEAHRSPEWGDRTFLLDSDASACGHAARLLAILSHRLTHLQRQAALAGIDRATRRYAGQGDSHVRFDSVWMPASQFLRDQRDVLDSPSEWRLADLFAAFAFPYSESHCLSPADCDRRLADAYAGASDEVLSGAIAAVRAHTDRTTAIGAALWLMTLGPAAKTALGALDEMADGTLDDYAREQARTVSASIRNGLLLAQDTAEAAAQGQSFAQQQIARLLRTAADGEQPGSSRGAPVTDLIDLLGHPSAYVRAMVADGLATLMPTSAEIAAAIPALEQMLMDDAFVEIGVQGEFECEGRLFHWRQERQSPRASAIRALFADGRIPHGDRMLKAMLAEATFAKVVCGKSAAPQRFALAQWRIASEAAGGLSVADPLIRATRQQCQEQLSVDNNGPYVCTAELVEVIRVLSGRVVP